MRDGEAQPKNETYEDKSEETCTPPDRAELCASATTLEQAASRNCLDRVSELLSTNGLDSKKGLPSAALATAIKLGFEPIARLLIEKGAAVNPETNDEWLKPLVLAARWRRIGILQAIIKAGADVDQKDENGITWLASYGVFDTRVSRILVEAGADANARDDHGATPLMHASNYGY